MSGAKQKESKNARRRALKKAKKQEPATASTEPAAKQDAPESDTEAKAEPVRSPVVDVYEPSEDDPYYEEFKKIMVRFQEPEKDPAETEEAKKPEIFYDNDDDIPDEDQDKQKLSKKQRKALSKLSIAELKAIVAKPELVEWTDVNSSDPRLLMALKSYRNVVPVPAHWSLKREYLSSKRGIEKPPFSLPKFIQETGIAEMRDAVLEKQAEQSLKQKQRERVQPKMGKLDIDYQKMWDAFFKFQTKPELTRYGEVYYEGKEYEVNLRHLKPGELSEDLRKALSMPPGAPPPWLLNMQRFGPPPSYPTLKIPGLNAPPPPGGQWGFHPGGYGKPPVDEFNRPLYGGDIYGIVPPTNPNQPTGAPVNRTLWGELKPREEEEEEEESEEEDEDEEMDEEEAEDVGAGMQTPSGLETPGGLASTVPSEFGGTESIGGDFTLRKQRRGIESEEPSGRAAYTVLQEQSVRTQGFFGSDRVYDLKTAQPPPNIPLLGQEENSRKRKVGDIDVSVDVDALQREDRLSKDEIKKQYDANRKDPGSQWNKVDQDDLSSMIAEENRKRQKKEEEKKGRR
ncbi:DUF382-domain-containing protein [Trichodelitschia bisporula]|uniref:DUF382-domain-containing protein n=1 Tax=Trichodelitschia bisporula TaxID=703511 RepID=A0A6G1HMV5_9PEZI|nr:DUF382-domain-containing protein [Trichodelitschia bisporula]